jgi:hypothetical protein
MWSQIRFTLYLVASVSGLLVALTTSNPVLGELSKGLSVALLLLALKNLYDGGFAGKS